MTSLLIAPGTTVTASHSREALAHVRLHEIDTLLQRVRRGRQPTRQDTRPVSHRSFLYLRTLCQDRYLYDIATKLLPRRKAHGRSLPVPDLWDIERLPSYMKHEPIYETYLDDSPATAILIVVIGCFNDDRWISASRFLHSS